MDNLQLSFRCISCRSKSPRRKWVSGNKCNFCLNCFQSQWTRIWSRVSNWNSRPRKFWFVRFLFFLTPWSKRSHGSFWCLKIITAAFLRKCSHLVRDVYILRPAIFYRKCDRGTFDAALIFVVLLCSPADHHGFCLVSSKSIKSTPVLHSLVSWEWGKIAQVPFAHCTMKAFLMVRKWRVIEHGNEWVQALPIQAVGSGNMCAVHLWRGRVGQIWGWHICWGRGSWCPGDGMQFGVLGQRSCGPNACCFLPCGISIRAVWCYRAAELSCQGICVCAWVIYDILGRLHLLGAFIHGAWVTWGGGASRGDLTHGGFTHPQGAWLLGRRASSIGGCRGVAPTVSYEALPLDCFIIFFTPASQSQRQQSWRTGRTSCSICWLIEMEKSPWRPSGRWGSTQSFVLKKKEGDLFSFTPAIWREELHQRSLYRIIIFRRFAWRAFWRPISGWRTVGKCLKQKGGAWDLQTSQMTCSELTEIPSNSKLLWNFCIKW